MKNLGMIGGRISILFNPMTRGYVLTSGGNVKEMSEQESLDMCDVIHWHRQGMLDENFTMLSTFVRHVPPEGFCGHGVKLTEIPCKWCEAENTPPAA